MSLNVYRAITTIYTQFLTLICPLTGVEYVIEHLLDLPKFPHSNTCVEQFCQPTNVLRYTVSINTDNYLMLSFTMKPSQPQQFPYAKAPKECIKSMLNMSLGKHFNI